MLHEQQAGGDSGPPTITLQNNSNIVESGV